MVIESVTLKQAQAEVLGHPRIRAQQGDGVRQKHLGFGDSLKSQLEVFCSALLA